MIVVGDGAIEPIAIPNAVRRVGYDEIDGCVGQRAQNAGAIALKDLIGGNMLDSDGVRRRLACAARASRRRSGVRGNAGEAGRDSDP
jgi:hypothetical protein